MVWARGLNDQPVSTSLEWIRGAELSEVTFILDYLCLTFQSDDTFRLNCFVWPRVLFGGEEYEFGDEAFRNALCSLICSEVIDVSETAGGGLVLLFDGGGVRIQPCERDLVGPEIAMLHEQGGAGRWDVWRVGEGIFGTLPESKGRST
ncbi:hypothetical protein DOE76_08070 [Leifsonia sp. ku-ls]|nr:hypothetical protein DOE76_08070 [Leifsonia sp. ku-ls]